MLQFQHVIDNNFITYFVFLNHSSGNETRAGAEVIKLDVKLVVSNPYSISVIEKVKVRGDDGLKLDGEAKAGRSLPIAKISPSLADRLGVRDSVITLRFHVEGKKVKLHLKTVVDSSLEHGLVLIPSELIADKIGELEAEAEAFHSKAWQILLDERRARGLIGLKIGDYIDAGLIGLKGKLLITGGSDASGFPMRPDVHGGAKVSVLLSGPPGFKPRRKGERRRKTIRGNTITPDIVQVNVKWIWEERKER